MLVVHKFEACRRCRGTTMWRLMKCDLLCERCQRRKGFPRRRPSPFHLAVVLGLLMIVGAWVALAFGEERSRPDRLVVHRPLRTAEATGLEPYSGHELMVVDARRSWVCGTLRD